MSNTTEIGLIALHSEFVGKSQMRVRTRLVGKSSTLLVDVTELGPTTSKKRALTAATDAARLAGSSGKAVLVSDHQSVRPANRLDPETGHVIAAKPTAVRSTTFMFKV